MKKYTYKRRSDRDLQNLRALSTTSDSVAFVDPKELITEVLDLRRMLKSVRQMGMKPNG